MAEQPDEAAQVAWRVADVSGWPEWMQAPALGRSMTPVVRRVIDAVDAHRAQNAPADLTTQLADAASTFVDMDGPEGESIARAIARAVAPLVVSRAEHDRVVAELAALRQAIAAKADDLTEVSFQAAREVRGLLS